LKVIDFEWQLCRKALRRACWLPILLRREIELLLEVPCYALIMSGGASGRRICAIWQSRLRMREAGSGSWRFTK